MSRFREQVQMIMGSQTKDDLVQSHAKAPSGLNQCRPTGAAGG
jgi:hypothetical protein